MSLYAITSEMRARALVATMKAIASRNSGVSTAAVRILLAAEKLNEQARYNDELAARMDEIEKFLARAQANVPSA